MALHCYHPELNEPKPGAQIEASLAHYGKHYYIKTPLALKGRGIEFLETFSAQTINNPSKVGWHNYKVTLAAFDKICREHSVSSELLLD